MYVKHSNKRIITIINELVKLKYDILVYNMPFKIECIICTYTDCWFIWGGGG